jgi:hypothetical protein
MKKQFGKLHKRQQEKIEGQYHQLKPESLNERMSQATRHSPAALRLSPKLVQSLQSLAESEGEPGYQTMARRWIEERLQQERSAGAERA